MSAVPPPPPDPSPEVLARYVEGPLDVASSVRVELAMQRSAEVRGRVGALVDGDRLLANLAAINAEIDAPAPRLLERALRRVGFGPGLVRLLVATPALRRSWFIALGIALLFALAAADPARPDGGLLFFLAVAPLIPVVGVALAYGPGVDPAYEMTVATPISGFRLVLVRSLAVLAVSLPLAGLAAALVPEPGPMAVAWLVPALALSAGCLALMTWLPPRRAAGWLSGSWLVAVVFASNRTDDVLLAFRPGAQLLVGALGLVAALVVYRRREAFEVARAGVV